MAREPGSVTMKRHLASLICLFTLLSGVSLLSGCGSAKASASRPATTATPAATATPATTTYTSSDGQFTLQYPSRWTVKVIAEQKTSGLVVFSNGADGEQFLIEPLTVQLVPNYPAILKDGLSKPADSQNATVDMTTSTASYPSGAWTVASGTATLASIPMTAHLYGIVHSGHTVIILTFAPSSSATTDQSTYFAPMLTSFTFLK
jgi:hypothetical protein